MYILHRCAACEQTSSIEFNEILHECAYCNWCSEHVKIDFSNKDDLLEMFRALMEKIEDLEENTKVRGE